MWNTHQREPGAEVFGEAVGLGGEVLADADDEREHGADGVVPVKGGVGGFGGWGERGR